MCFKLYFKCVVVVFSQLSLHGHVDPRSLLVHGENVMWNQTENDEKESDGDGEGMKQLLKIDRNNCEAQRLDVQETVEATLVW